MYVKTQNRESTFKTRLKNVETVYLSMTACSSEENSYWRDNL